MHLPINPGDGGSFEQSAHASNKCNLAMARLKMVGLVLLLF